MLLSLHFTKIFGPQRVSCTQVPSKRRVILCVFQSTIVFIMPACQEQKGNIKCSHHFEFNKLYKILKIGNKQVPL